MASIAVVPYFICPNCKRRSIDHDRRDGLTHQAVGCPSCGFGFLFELTGFQERELLGREVEEAFGLGSGERPSPAEVAVEWGVRQLGKELELQTKAGVRKAVKVDFFPAYDEDGGLLVALAPA